MESLSAAHAAQQRKRFEIAPLTPLGAPLGGVCRALTRDQTDFLKQDVRLTAVFEVDLELPIVPDSAHFSGIKPAIVRPLRHHAQSLLDLASGGNPVDGNLRRSDDLLATVIEVDAEAHGVLVADPAVIPIVRLPLGVD